MPRSDSMGLLQRPLQERLRARVFRGEVLGDLLEDRLGVPLLRLDREDRLFELRGACEVAGGGEGLVAPEGAPGRGPRPGRRGAVRSGYTTVSSGFEISIRIEFFPFSRRRSCIEGGPPRPSI